MVYRMRIAFAPLWLIAMAMFVGCGHTLKPRPPEAFEETDTGWHENDRGESVYGSREERGMRFIWDVEHE